MSPGPSLVLVLGGARSGKSEVAEAIAARPGDPVTYLATMSVGDDSDLAARVERHRARRAASWSTVEAGIDLPGRIRAATGTVLVDSLGPWVAAHDGTAPATEDLCAALSTRHTLTVVVSEEVGMGVHPASEAGRRFRDVLGEVNQAVAAVSDQVLLVVAGRVLPLSPG